MNATDEIRRMLDERGVEWEDGGEGLTIIPAQDGVPRAWTVNTWPSAKDTGDCLWMQNRHPLTPEQAIAATTGRGECHLEINTSMTAVVCDKCNYPMPSGTVLTEVHFCPNCGRRVVA